jgi:4-amino-4-deoxy-L-arabinose transferase-like glycosyltransferase
MTITGPEPNESSEGRSAVAPASAVRGHREHAPATPLFQFVLVLGSAVYLFVNLFTFRGTPFLLGGDQVLFWTYAQRMFIGQRVYLDFFEFTPPGTDLVYLAAFRLFGPRVWTTNLIVLLLGVTLSWLCFRLALRIMPRSRALLAAVLFLVLIYGKLLNATHHWFCQVVLLSAVLVLLQRRTMARIAIAGGLLGLAAFFTQTTGGIAAAAVMLFFLWEWFATRASLRILLRQCALLMFGFAVVWGAASAHWLATVGIRRLLSFQAVYPARFMVDRWSNWSLGLPDPHAPGQLASFGQAALVYLLLPFTYLICGLLLWRRRNTSSPNTARIALLTFVGLATLLEVARSPSWLRLYCAAAPGIVLLVWLLRYVTRMQFLTSLFLWIAIACLAISQVRSRYREQSVIVDTPAGVVATRTSTADKLLWIGARTRPGELFFQAGWSGLYLPLSLRNPAFFDMLENRDTTPPEYVQLTVRQLDDQNVQYILSSPSLEVPNPIDGPAAYHLAPFIQFLHQRYHRVWTFSDLDQVWERN